VKPGAVRLTEESEDDLAAMRRAIRRTPGFALYVVVARDRARGAAVARLKAWSRRKGMPGLHFFPSGKEAGSALMRFLAGQGPAAPLTGAVLPDGDRLVEEVVPVLELNVVRDRLKELVAGPLIVVLSARAEAAFGRMAPDLFDIRAATCEVEAEQPADAGGMGPVRERPAVSAPAARRRVQSEEELRALEASAEPPPAAALADAWLGLAIARDEAFDRVAAEAAAQEAARLARAAGYGRAAHRALRILARAYVWAGRMDEAEATLREALGLAETGGDERGRALTLGQIADILEMRGELDEALRIRKDEELPVYERLGDVHSYAVTMSQIAHILYEHGELDEALRIQKEEVLPVYERLGVARERAITMGQIADIRYMRGELDEALRIQKEEVLPTYERIGDVLSGVVGRFNLALTYLARGRPGDRAEASILLRLALQDAERMHVPEAEQIRAIQREHKLLDEAAFPVDGS
jgi:tetratricopeptide (TPR) repeat protein